MNARKLKKKTFLEKNLQLFSFLEKNLQPRYLQAKLEGTSTLL